MRRFYIQLLIVPYPIYVVTIDYFPKRKNANVII